MARLYGPNIVDDAGGTEGGVTTVGKAESLPTISEDIRLILALKGSDTNLNAAWEAYKAGNLDEMYAAIYRSDFYKNNTTLARQRQAAQKTQKGAYDSQLNDWKLKTRKRLTAAGIKVSPQVEAQLETAYLLGMSDDQVDSVLSSKGLLGQIGGQTGGQVNTLKSYARSFGVDEYYNQSYWNEKSKALFDGTTTAEDIQAEIRGLSSSMFPAFADDINAGRSLDSIGSYITTIVSQRLGRPVTTSSPEVKRFLQWKNPESGKFEKPPGWLIDQEAWKLPGADRTPDAIAKADNIALRVLQDWGLI